MIRLQRCHLYYYYLLVMFALNMSSDNVRVCVLVHVYFLREYDVRYYQLIVYKFIQ